LSIIDFNGAKLYRNKQKLMGIGFTLLIAAGCLVGPLLVIGSVIAIFYCIRKQPDQTKKGPAVKVKDKERKPVNVAIQVDSPAKKKTRSLTKTANEKQAPKRTKNQQKATISEATIESVKPDIFDTYYLTAMDPNVSKPPATQQSVSKDTEKEVDAFTSFHQDCV